MKNQMRGCVRINASGKYIYRFINMIHCGHIHCFGQYCRKDVFYGEIYRHDLPKVEKMAEECGVKLTCAEYMTVSSVLLRYKKRIGLILGAVLVLTSALYFSNVIVTIDILGNSIVSDDEVLSALRELDIKRGTPIKKLDLHYCENELRVKVDKITWAGIRRTGNRLVVELTEVTDRPEMTLNRVPCDLIADRDACITAVTVKDGLLMKKVGEFVPRGTVLVSGMSTDEYGHTLVRHAMGEIRGSFTETVTFTEPFASSEYTPTGNTSKRRYIKLFSLDIPLFGGRESFESAEVSSSESTLSLFGKDLPLGFVIEDISETELTETSYSDSELEARIMQKIYLYEKNFIGEDKTLISRNISTERTSDALVSTVTYVLEGNIAIPNEIYVK